MDILNTKNKYEVRVLYTGYSRMNENNTEMKANCSCTLVQGPQHIVIDTMTAWDKDKIINGLLGHGLKPEDINYVICTHGHSDHTGNNNLFLNAKHIVGYSVSFQDIYYLHPFEEDVTYKIDENVEVIPTPGHTLSDVTLIVKTQNNGIYAIAGDLFERFEDIENPSLWIDAGSESQELQRKHRYKVSQIADWIIPGHGPIFKCTQEVRTILEKQCEGNKNA